MQAKDKKKKGAVSYLLLLCYLLLQCISSCSSKLIFDGNSYNEIKEKQLKCDWDPFAFLKMEGS